MFQENEWADSELIEGLPGAESWCEMRTIQQGDSNVCKRMVVDSHGDRFFVRFFDHRRYDGVKREYGLLHLLHENGLPVPEPVDFGFCRQGQSVYIRSRWIEGEVAAKRLPLMPATDQYMLGHQLAVGLYALHSCAAPSRNHHWSYQVHQEIMRMKRQCSSQQKQVVQVQRVLRFIEENRSVVERQPQVLLHGDLNPGNIIVSYERMTSLIDFTQWHFGDPIFDLATILSDIKQISPSFAVGVLDCYFQYHVNTRVFRLLAVYSAMRSIRRYLRSCHCDEASRQAALNDMQQMVRDYNGFRSVVPLWYRSMPRFQA